MVADGGADLGIGAQRRADHHQIGALDAMLRIVMDAIEITQLPGLVPGLLAAGRAGHMARQTVALDDAGERASDQPEADQRHPIEERRAHGRSAATAPAPAKSASAAASARTSASVPMVRRRHR